ncbi:MAG: hypothetical protein Q4F79_06580 [Eubacteriales bacterium]|nr:hypothetical protein [Eubacteriales bacterium]
MKLKKSYKGFVLWIFIFFIVLIGVSCLPIDDSRILVRIVDNACSLGITCLAFLIYKTEYVYWYSGTSYEDAQKAGSERRNCFAWEHFKKFGLFSLAFLLFSVLAQILQFPIWIDIVVLAVGLVAVACRTISISL